MNRFISWEMVGGFFLLLIALGVAYGGNTPSQLGHSPDEIKWVVATYVENCDSGTADGSCIASCAQPFERAIGGSCVAQLGYAFSGWAVTDALDNQVAWECTDRTHDFGAVLRAQVNCLKTGGP